MKILVISSWQPYPPDNGSQIRAYHLLRQLSRRHEVTLLAFGESIEVGGDGPLRSLGTVVELVSPTSIDRARLKPHGLLSATPRHLIQNWSRRMEALVARHLEGKDVAIGLQLDAARYLLPWNRLPRVFEEVEVAMLRDQYLGERRIVRRARHALTWWKFRRYIRHLVNSFDAATVVSAPEREHLRSIGCDPTRLHVVPNGVDLPAQTPVRKGARVPRLIYPGAITYSANLDAVRYFTGEILPIIRRSRPELEFWVTGSTEGIDTSDLSAAGVIFTGRLPDVDALIADSTACVVPLRVGGGTRLKVLKAMSLLTPVVSTSKGVEGLEVEPDHHVMVADTPAAFASEVVRLAMDPSIGHRMSSNAFQVVRARYGWQGIGDALDGVLGDAVDRHRRHAAGSSSYADVPL